MAIAMTFDDGPRERTTPQLLDLLDELNLQVSFFVVGQMVRQSPVVLRRIAAARQQHEICNHSWSHPLRGFRNLTDDQVRDEIVNTQRAIEDVVGASRAARIVRPPGGFASRSQREFIRRELGYRVVGWNIDPRDWQRGRTSRQITQHITTHTRDGHVILAHDIHQRTIDAMPETLRQLKEKFAFYSVSRLGNFTEGGLAVGIQCGCNASFA